MLIVTFPVANMEPMNRFVMKTGWQFFSEKMIPLQAGMSRSESNVWMYDIISFRRNGG